MAQQIDIPSLVEILVAFGVFSTIVGAVKWLFSGRKRERVDNARIVQGMAMDLVTPLHGEMAILRASLDDANLKMGQLHVELDSVLGYALLCHELLIGNPKAPVPPPSVLRRVI